MLSAIVLGAGLSSRMGTVNKLLLPFNNKPVIVHIVETILQAGVPEVIVVTGHQADEIRNVLTGINVKFAHNEQYVKGMTSSIQEGVRAATGDGYMICLSDMVMIAAAEYRLLKDAFETRLINDPACICLPVYENKQGNPVIFSSVYKEAILGNVIAEGCRNIVQHNSQHHYLVDIPGPQILQDFDYPQDYHRLLPNM